MAIKLIALAALFGHLALAYQPLAPYPYQGYHDDDGGHVQESAAAHYALPYHFEYAVNDPHTHDVKNHHEAGDGHGNVKGSYSLLEADGSTRVVEYTADHEHGFVANVKKIEAAGHHGEYDFHHQPESPVSSYNMPSVHHY